MIGVPVSVVQAPRRRRRRSRWYVAVHGAAGVQRAERESVADQGDGDMSRQVAVALQGRTLGENTGLGFGATDDG